MTKADPTGTHRYPVRALVVDDHLVSRRYTVAALRQSGAAVKAAGTPQAALEAALEWHPEVVFVDLELPGMTGFEWIDRLMRAWPAQRTAPRLVVLTAHRQVVPPPGRADRAIDAVLLKPATPAELRAALEPQRGFDVRERPADLRACAPTPAVAALFRRELAMRLRALDRLLARRDLVTAGTILHQLIASSRICREPRLESELRALHALCRTEAVGDEPGSAAGADEVGRRYYALLARAAPLLRHAGASG